MDLKQIKELMAAMGRAGIKKLSIKEKSGYELLLEGHDEHPPLQQQDFYHRFAQPHLQAAHPLPQPHHHHSVAAKEPASNQEEKVDGKYVTSPMVGTFYACSSPEDPPFIKVGDTVDENTVVCIIEAMKVMNEVKAGVSGKIAEICIENAHPVEFGTKLFRIV